MKNRKWKNQSWFSLKPNKVILLIPTTFEVSIFGVKKVEQNHKGDMTLTYSSEATLQTHCPDFELSNCVSILDAKERVENGNYQEN